MRLGTVVRRFYIPDRNPVASRLHSQVQPNRSEPASSSSHKMDGRNSLDHGPPVVLQAGLQLLQDPAALLQLRDVPVRERHVVDAEASLLVHVQQGGNSVPVELCPAAEYKDLLHPLVLELLWWEKTSNSHDSPQE